MTRLIHCAAGPTNNGGAAPGKSQTYSVEVDNSVLRHYLARLVRCSRCFSRSFRSLGEAIKLFVFAWNCRQMYKRLYPTYPAHVRDIPMTLSISSDMPS